MDWTIQLKTRGMTWPPAAPQASLVAMLPLKPNLEWSTSDCGVPKGSEAEIDMFMPAGDAEREALVDLVFGVALGRGVHGADELVAIADFYRGALGRGLRRRGRNETLANGRRVAR